MSPARRCSLHVGLAADDAGRRARRIDQDAVERRGRPTRSSAAVASPQRMSAASPSRARFSPMRGSRRASRSSATSSTSARSSMCAPCRPARRTHRARAGRRQDRADRRRAARRRPAPRKGLRHSPATRHVARCARARSRRRDRRARSAAMPPASRRSIRSSRVARRRFTRSVSGASRLFAARIVSIASGQSRRSASMQPARMRGARDLVAIELRIDFGALAHEAAQHRVDETAVARMAERARGVDRRGDDRIVRQSEHLDLRHPEHEQRAHVAQLRRQRFFQQHCERGIEPQPPARRGEQRRRQQRAIARRRRSAAPFRRARRAAKRRRTRCAPAPAQLRRAARRRGSRCGSALASRVPVVAHAHAAAAFALHFEDAQHALAGGDVERIARVADDRARSGVVRCGDRTRGDQMRRRSPFNSASATGHGSNARTLRSSAIAGSFQSRRASVLSSLCA